MGNIWHIGLAVPDLENGLREIGALFDLAWRPVVTRSMTIKDEEGRFYDIDCQVTFSLGGPFAVEVWQAIPNTPLAVPESGYLHHIGYWVENQAVENEHLDDLGYPLFLSSAPGLFLRRGPGNLLIEPCDLQRDQPYLRDLYPADAKYRGEPIFPEPHVH